MKISTLTLIATLLTPLSTHLYGQSQTGALTPGTTPTGVLPPAGTVPDTQIQTSPGAQINSGTGTVDQPATGGGGVFGPSAGPGIFGPTRQATTDIYGNQQATPGTSVQGSTTGVVPVPQGNALNRRQGLQGQAATRPTDSQGNPLPLSSTPNQGQQAPLPNSINPLPQAPAGTMTGR